MRIETVSMLRILRAAMQIRNGMHEDLMIDDHRVALVCNRVSELGSRISIAEFSGVLVPKLRNREPRDRNRFH